MNKELITRVEKVSDYILKTEATIRKTAKEFNISKSTVHKDIRIRLKEIDSIKYEKISNILTKHLKTRHILGGQSTKLKYQLQKLKEG